MNGILVGQLERLSATGMRFEYAQSWLDRDGARPVSLSLPLSARPYTDDRVWHFFDNLLPDNPSIRARIQRRFKTRTNQAFDLLAQVGRDCVGALQLVSDEVADVQQISAKPIATEEIARVLRNYLAAPESMDRSMDDFRISIAGAQEKTALLWHDDQWCWPLGSTPTTHIFKLPIGVLPYQQMDLSMSCENEWLCAQIVNAFGLDVAPCWIEQFDDVKVLVVERFDRQIAENKKWIMRLPQEDLCQALAVSPELKYQVDGGPGVKDIMQTLLGSIDPEQDRMNFFKAQIVFWLLAAIDGHAKNFSVFIKAYGQFNSTPLYDIMSAHPLLANKQLQVKKIKMAMALRGKKNHYHWHDVQLRHFLSAAKDAQFSTNLAQQLAADTFSQVGDVIARVSRQLPADFPVEIYEPIFEGMSSMVARLSVAL